MTRGPDPHRLASHSTAKGAGKKCYNKAKYFRFIASIGVGGTSSSSHRWETPNMSKALDSTVPGVCDELQCACQQPVIALVACLMAAFIA